MKVLTRAFLSLCLRFAQPKGFAAAWCLISLMQSVLTMTVPAQTTVGATPGEPSPVMQEGWASSKVTHLIGLPEVKSKLQGRLKLSPTALTFTTLTGDTTILRSNVLSVSIGDERMERGGTMGKIARSAIPFGGGQALATMTGSQVDLLTIEFRDPHNAYHGVVFLLPKDEAVHAQQQFAFVPLVHLAVPTVPTCLAGAARPSALRVAGVATHGAPLPPEYKVLLYEHLIRRLHDQPGLAGIYRDGDTSEAAACPELTLALTVNAFKKGNAVLRASTGPLGIFIGTTQLKFHMELHDDKGRVLLDKDLKASQRGDNESLEIADDIARSVSKKLKRANINANRYDLVE